LKRFYLDSRHRAANFAYPRVKAWCDRREAHEAAVAQVAQSSPAPEGPYPNRPATGAGALVVADPPAVEVRRQNAEQAAANISRFMNERLPVQGPTSGPGAKLAHDVGELSWYHTIELPHGIITPGAYDHRPLVQHYGLPETLAGQRALDIATADGFWAFELERRGADVTAVDIARVAKHDFPPAVRAELIRRGFDRPTGEGFNLARNALGSSVQRWEESIYSLSPDERGKFDFVHISDVLLHLERPLDALRRVYDMTGGQALISDNIDPTMPRNGVRYAGDWETVTYWVPSPETLAQMVSDAGFSTVRVHTLYSLALTAPNAIGPWRMVVIAEP
jgi:tRNA (mo5U34)-methyltransferase